MNASAGIDTVKMHQLLLYVVYSFGCEGTGGRGRGLQREGCLINFLLQKGGGVFEREDLIEDIRNFSKVRFLFFHLMS